MPMVWVLAVVFLLEQVGVYTMNIWMPLLLTSFVNKSDPHSGSFIAGISTIPYLAAAIMTVVVGWSSDKFSERRWHIAGCMILAALGFGWAAYAHSLVTTLLAMIVAGVGFWSMTGPFWALPTRVLGGQAAAGGVAIITMIGSLGAFAGPTLTGKMKDLTHNYSAGLLVVGGLAVLGAVLCVFIKTDKQQDAANLAARRPAA